MKMTNREQALLVRVFTELRAIERTGLSEWFGNDDATEAEEIALCEAMNELRIKIEDDEPILTERDVWEAVEGHPCEAEDGFEQYIEAYINATPEDERTNADLDQYLSHL